MKSLSMDASSNDDGQIESVNLSRVEAAHLIGLGLRTLDQRIKEKTVPSFKIGGRRFFNRDVLIEWNKKRAEEAAALSVEGK